MQVEGAAAVVEMLAIEARKVQRVGVVHDDIRRVLQLSA